MANKQQTKQYLDLVRKHGAYDSLCEALGGEKNMLADLADNATVREVLPSDRNQTVPPHTLSISDMETYSCVWFPALGRWIEWDQLHWEVKQDTFGITWAKK